MSAYTLAPITKAQGMQAGNFRQQMRAWRVFAALCLLLCSTGSRAADAAANQLSPTSIPLIELPTEPTLALKPYLLLRKATSDAENLQDIVATLNDTKQWQSPQQVNDAGYDAFWLQLHIHNGTNSAKKMWIDQPNGLLPLMKLYVLKQQQILHQYEAGSTVPSSRWPSDALAMLFPLTVEPGDTLDIVIFIQQSALLVIKDLTLWESDTYATRFDIVTSTHWMYSGAVGLMILYNFMLFIFTRDRSYAYYVFFAASCWATFFTSIGYDRWLFWPEATTWNTLGFHLLHSIQFIAAILFAQNFLNLREKSPRGFWLLNVFVALMAIIFVVQLLGPTTPNGAIIALRFAMTLPILMTLWIIPLQLLLRGDRTALLYFVAASVYLLAWIATTLWILGVLPTLPMMRNAVIIGQTIELVVLSVALANRINEHKQSEQMAKLAMQEKSEFLAKMSHEIRTPMNGVISMADLLLTMNLPSTAKQCAGIIQSSAQSLVSIINEILDYSKLEAGKLALNEELSDPAIALRDAVALFEALALEKRLTLIAVIAPDVPQVMRLDNARVRQILMNLINNAIKFTHRGAITVDARRTEKQLVIKVIDTGIGITQQQRENIFSNYQQGASDTAARYGGTGLGLAICKQLLQLMRGDIDVESTPQRGSTFTIRLPLREPQLTRVDSGIRDVALVCDDALYIELLTAWLAQQDICCKVFETAQGLSAWQANIDTSTALILIDSTLPPQIFAACLDALQNTNVAHLAILPSIRHSINASAALQVGEAALLARIQHLPRSIISTAWWNTLKQIDNKPAPSLSMHRILVADDDATNRIIMGKLLRELGQEPVIVSNGEEALDAYFRRDVDLLILDCNMPKLDGISVTRRIREIDANTSRTPIIALTAHATDKVFRDYEAAGANLLLTKPISLDRLRTALQTVFNAG